MKRVLWLDEEPASLRYERRMAELAGWQITTAATVEEAERLVGASAFDVVVVDLVVPLNDHECVRGRWRPEAGLDFLRFVTDPSRTGATPRDVQVLVCSATVSPEVRQSAQAYLKSPGHYLLKPVREDLWRLILQTS